MVVLPLGIDGAWVFTPRQFSDGRGYFQEAYKASVVAEAVGHPLTLAQANLSVSRAGVLRGVHFADVPPSQAKYVSCAHGAVLDVVVDIRTGSPTFGAVEAVRLDDADRRGLYLAEGLGHAFLALTDDAVVTYLVSTPFTPGAEHGVTPLDPDLALASLPGWPSDLELVLSDKDRDAPTLAVAEKDGLLPTYAACQALYADLRA